MHASQLMAFPKPRTRKSLKAKKDRAEVAVAKSVRAECVERDGHYCRIGFPVAVSGDVLPDPRGGMDCCSGPSEWAHLGRHRRAHTRGMSPEKRHTTQGSLMLCRRHHHDYDAGLMGIRALSLKWADGPLRFFIHRPKGITV